MKNALSCAAACLLVCLSASAAIPANERNALMALYNSAGGAQWSFNGGWGGAAGTECDWVGVTCDGAQTTVTELRLRANNLAGTIPPAIGDLAGLQQLDLGNNALTGAIPAELSRLSKLTALDLNNNQLTGSIPPVLGSLSNLTELDLDTNEIAGPIPPELGNLGQLEVLDLSDNNLTGTIPSELTRLSKLTRLNLGFAKLTGTLPDMSAWPSLTFLALNDNQLSGSIPATVGQLVSLDQLYLQTNKLTGGIPPQIGNLTKLRVLVLSDNQLSGAPPAELFGMTSLEDLDVGQNQLTGTLPSAIGRLTKLTTLALNDNGFAGALPAELTSLSQLDWLDLSTNAFSGTVPTDLDRLSSLEHLDFGSNQLTGTIPISIGNMPKLQYLGLSDNRLTGTIPPQLASAASLQSIVLHDNALTGTIPDAFRGLKNLQTIYVGSNRLSGPLPSWLPELPKLQGFLAGGNAFTGTIPANLTSVTNLDYFDVGDNQLTGTIPSDVGKLQSLAYLTLEHNEIGGPIPDSFWTLTQLRDVRLAELNLTGTLPSAIGNLTNLGNFDVEDNDLSGPLPPEIGRLSGLTYLSLGGNRFSGTLPRELGQLTSLQSVDFSANDFRSPIPPELMNMNVVDGGADFSYNAFSIPDPTLAAYVNRKQFDHDFAHTQTVTPTAISVSQLTDRSAVVSWTPIQYQYDEGGYRVFASTTPGGTPVAVATTATKEAGSITVRGLQPSTTYSFTVAAVTHPHDFQHNLIVSELSAPVTGSTGARQLAPADVVLTATPTGLIQLDGSPQNEDSFTLTNFGDVATSITLDLFDNDFYTVSPAAFTLAGGASQTVRLTSIPNQPPGVRYGGVVPRGNGTSDDDIVTVTLLSAKRAGGTAIAEPATNRIEIAGDPGTDSVGQVTFRNKGTATLTGILVADVPWLVPNPDPISIDPGSSALVRFKVMRSRRPSGVLGGALTGTLSLVYVAEIPGGSADARVQDTTPPSGISISKVTVVDVSKPDVGSATAPQLGTGEVAYFVAGLLDRTNATSSLASDIHIVNAFGSKPVSDVRLYYTSSAQNAVATLSTIGSAQGVSLANVVGNVYGATDQIGSIQVRSAGWQNLIVNANFLRLTGTGTLLGDLPVFRSDRALRSGEKLYLTGINQAGTVHPTLVLEEIAGTAANVLVEFRTGSGSPAGQQTVPLSPSATTEVTSIPAAATTIIVTNATSSSPTGVLAYVRMSDDASGDTWSVVDWSRAEKFQRTQAVRLALVVPGGGGGRRRIVKQSDSATPRAVTSVSLFNSGSIDARAKLSAGTASKEVSVPAGQTVTISDAGSFLGLTSSQSAVIEPLRGEVAVTSRITTLTAAGSVGTAEPVVPAQSGLRVGQSQVFSALEDSAAYRTDYGFVETSGAAATIRATLLLSDARSLFTTVVSRDFRLDPGAFVYVNELVKSIVGQARSTYGDLHDLQLQLDVTDGSGSVLPFVVMTDNATGDTILRVE